MPPVSLPDTPNPESPGSEANPVIRMGLTGMRFQFAQLGAIAIICGVFVWREYEASDFAKEQRRETRQDMIDRRKDAERAHGEFRLSMEAQRLHDAEQRKLSRDLMQLQWEEMKKLNNATADEMRVNRDALISTLKSVQEAVGQFQKHVVKDKGG